MNKEDTPLKDKRLDDWINRLNNDFLESAKRFEEQEIHRTIVFFGSSKIKPWEAAQQQMLEVDSLFDKAKRRTEKQWETLDKASNAVYMSRFYDAADELAYMLAKWGKQPEKLEDQYVVCSGGGPGIMEAANRGAHRADARSVGLAIDLEKKQGRNVFITPELQFEFTNFLIRKFWFFYYARAIIVFPGGMGTMDELTEVLTLIQTKKMDIRVPIVLYGSEYWNDIVDFDPMVTYDTIEQEHLLNIKVVDDVEEAYEYIIKKIKDNHF